MQNAGQASQVRNLLKIPVEGAAPGPGLVRLPGRGLERGSAIPCVLRSSSQISEQLGTGPRSDNLFG